MTDSVLMLQIRSNCVVSYFRNTTPADLTPEQREAIRLLMIERRKEAYKNKFSDGAKKRVGRAIDLLVQIAKTRYIDNPVTGKKQRHRLSFITLTISQHKNITAKEAYDKGLVHFLQWFRRTMGVRTYVWKCEVQKRGQIHYHITTPNWIHYQKIRDKWNNIQRENNWLDDYYKLKGHYDPNSTDIGEVQHVKDLSGYLKKEFCKAIQNPECDGKVWDCSMNLKKFGFYQTPVTAEMLSNINKLNQQKKITIKTLDQCEIYIPDKQGLEQFISLTQIQEYDTHRNNIRNFKKDT